MSDHSMWTGDAYHLLMGRWSQLLAAQFVRFAAIQDGQSILDVGCGTGSLARALLDIGPETRVTGVDSSADFVGIAADNLDPARTILRQADAQSLPFADAAFDACASLLVLNFIPVPARAAAEMRRVTRPGGTVAAAVWDYGEGMEMLCRMWDAAVTIDPNATSRHERNMPLCRAGELAALWTTTGLTSVSEAPLTIRMDFRSFDDYWAPFLTGVGPSGSYVSGLTESARERLRSRLSEMLCQGREDREFRLSGRAWAVQGKVP